MWDRTERIENVMLQIHRTFSPGLLLLLVMAAPMSVDGRGQQNVNGSPATEKELSPITIRNLLRQPGGLESCAKLVGHFVIRDKRPLLSRSSLTTLTDTSPLILIGRVADSKASLIEDGDSILTTYTIVPEMALKGIANGNLMVRVRGGTITFAEGTSAQIITQETEEIRVGGRYCLFLKNGQNTDKVLTNGEESVFGLTDSATRSAATQSLGSHPIVDETRSMSPAQLIAKVQAIVSQKQLLP